MTTDTVDSKQKTDRPQGVWLLTIYALIFAGILPLIVELVLVYSSEFRQSADVNYLSIFFSILISVGVIVSAVGTWRGNSRARISFIVLVTIHWGLVGINNAIYLLANPVSIDQQSKYLGRVFRGILTSSLYNWYFCKKTTFSFFLFQ